jgi:hypothetical protein
MGGLDKDDKELEVILDWIGEKHLTSGTYQQKSMNIDQFVFAGSAAAYFSAKKSGKLADLGLVYNDIDVFITRGELSDDAEPDSQSWQVGLCKEPVAELGETEINIVFHSKLNPASLVKTFDINCVAVGFLVEKKPQNSTSTSKAAKFAETSSEWKVTAEYLHPSFQEFLDYGRVRILQPLDKVGHPPITLIRILFKAHQMGLPYDFPPEDQLVHAHERCVSQYEYEKLAKMSTQHREEITRRFKFECIPVKGNLFWMFLLKGATDSKMHRKVSELDWDMYRCSIFAFMYD